MSLVNDPQAAQTALTRFELASGVQRGSQLLLYPRCLVHRSDAHLETLPLARVNALRVAFERNPRQLGWGAALVVIALVLLALAGPLGTAASHAAGDMASSAQGVARALYALFRILEGIAAILPALALAAALSGAALGVFGWRGSTTLTVALGGEARVYSVRGRSTQLLDFAEMASERLMANAK